MPTEASTTTCTRPSLREETRIWVHTAIPVVPVPLAVQRWASQRTTAIVSSPPHGTLSETGVITMVRPTLVPSVTACTSVPTGLQATLSLSLSMARSAVATVSLM